jgi:signal transduction histidine kinase
VYSTRELALPGDLFRTLAALNHLGAFMFGCALVGLFLCYPQRLVKPRTLLWLPLVFGGWWLADAWQIAPDQDVGSRWPVMLELILAIFCAFLQWRKSRHEPADRAALRWLILSVVVGCGLFVFTTAGASMLGLFPPVSQGYSFGYFLIMYFGLALGVRRYRLFELDEWAYRILLWVAGALLVIGMDVLMIWMLGLRQDLSLGLALFVAGWLYFPVRQWLWRRWRGTRRFSFDAVLPALSQIAFAAVADAREQGWDHLLQEVYAPLTLHAEQPGGVNRVNRVSHVEVSADGLLLHVPACGRLAARRLHYADGGRRLFGAQDVEFMTSLCHLMNEADRGREAYERGVVQERSRIARDMHDDIGARLLTLTHRLRDPQEAELARAAIQDLRTTLGALEMQPKPLGDALADWRAEIESRCEAAAVVLHWQQAEDLSGYCLSARAKAMLERVLREAISNALRHAAARRIRVWQTLERDGLQLVIEDDGQATEAFLPEEGYGLASMQHRLDELGGRLQMTVAAAGHGLRLTVSLPLQSLDIS